MSASVQCLFLWFIAAAQHHIVPFLGCCHAFLAFPFMPTVPCGENRAVNKHIHIHTDVCTLHHHTYRLTVSHDCLLQTMSAKCDLLQHPCVLHYHSVIPHLSLSSSTPASLHSPPHAAHSLQLFSLFTPLSLLIFFFLPPFCIPLSFNLISPLKNTKKPMLFYLWFSFQQTKLWALIPPSDYLDLLAWSLLTLALSHDPFISFHLMLSFAKSILGCLFTSPFELNLNESKLALITLPILASMENDLMLQGHTSLV